MSDEGGSWAPFGRSSDDEPPEPVQPPAPVEEEAARVEEEKQEAATVEEPPPAPAPTPTPPQTFAPPAAPQVQPLPTPSAPPVLAWPDPAPRPEPPPAEQQAPWPPQGYQTAKPVPSDATVALVLGIASILFCGFVGPFAIHYGLKARRQIDADPKLGGRGLATWGYALGIVSTTVLVLFLILVAAGVIAISSLDT